LPRALVELTNGWSQRHGIAADVQIVGDIHLPSATETIIYRVVQEALTNILKHARARQVSIVLERRMAEVALVIEDDGVGFDPDRAEDVSPQGSGPPKRGLGLSSMKERLALARGTIRIESGFGAGTSLFCHIPVAPPFSIEHGHG
jgi:signal transduction histidine kinase